jgi:hypothetical protein
MNCTGSQPVFLRFAMDPYRKAPATSRAVRHVGWIDRPDSHMMEALINHKYKTKKSLSHWSNQSATHSYKT